MAPSNAGSDRLDSNANATSLPATEMIYYTYEGNFQLDCYAKILSCQFINDEEGVGDREDNKSRTTSRLVRLCLDRTVMHAQGGGQPTDTGTIHVISEAINNDSLSLGSTIIDVTNVLLDRTTGVATHTGRLTGVGKDEDDNVASDDSLLSGGQSVRVVVDADNRQILSECHTAGHVVDSAMAKCDMVLPATKAYHFLDGPYVEYKGNIPTDQREGLLTRLQKAFQELVDADIPTEIRYDLNRSQAEEFCNAVAGEGYFQLSDQFQDENETVRIVKVAGWPCPCGGTHVKSTGVLKERRWGITNFRCKKGVVRVKYGQNCDGN